MGRKTIWISDEVYERLAAEKREDESFTDAVARLLDETTSDWRHGFGRYAGSAGRELQRVVDEVQRSHAEGFAREQEGVLGDLGVELDERDDMRTTPGGADEDG